MGCRGRDATGLGRGINDAALERGCRRRHGSRRRDVKPLLQVALDSDAGYIGALGSRSMQQARADWLAYRDVTDLSRVHGPAGLDIGASTPAEIAVSIAAQIVSVTRTCE